jgi:hypothetical protein
VLGVERPLEDVLTTIGRIPKLYTLR